VPAVAVMVALLFPASTAAAAVKVAVLLPTEAVTVAGMFTLELLLVSATTKPPAAAGLLRVTEHVLEVPARTVAGVHATDTGAGDETTLSENALATPFSVAFSATVRSEVTAPEVAEKPTLADPAGITTLAGTVTTVLLLVSMTIAPPAGATDVMAKVQLAVDAEPIVPGLQVSAPTPVVG
jgi:hypothetical protein